MCRFILDGVDFEHGRADFGDTGRCGGNGFAGRPNWSAALTSDCSTISTFSSLTVSMYKALRFTNSGLIRLRTRNDNKRVTNPITEPHIIFFAEETDSGRAPAKMSNMPPDHDEEDGERAAENQNISVESANALRDPRIRFIRGYIFEFADTTENRQDRRFADKRAGGAWGFKYGVVFYVFENLFGRAGKIIGFFPVFIFFEAVV